MVVVILKVGGVCKLKCMEYFFVRLFLNIVFLECVLLYGFEGYLILDWM